MSVVRKVGRDSGNGQFVPIRETVKHPRTTEVEKINTLPLKEIIKERIFKTEIYEFYLMASHENEGLYFCLRFYESTSTA